MSETYDSRIDTQQHINRVAALLEEVAARLRGRGLAHDASKLVSPEREVFDAVTPRLRGLTYGSPEYKASLADLGPALEHHYAHNRHHPEHNTPTECIICFADVSTFVDGMCPHCGNGATGSPRHTLRGMTLIDVVEMLCDWKAATERHADGSIEKSLAHNKGRFHIGDEMHAALVNTAREMGWL